MSLRSKILLTTFLFSKRGRAIAIKLSKILKVRHVFAKRNTIALLTAIFGGISILAGVLTFYGQNAGNLVINSSEDAFSRGLILSENDDFINSAPRLFAEPAKNVSSFNLSLLPVDYIRNTNGNYYSEGAQNFLGYTFYLKNDGQELLNLDYTMLLQEATRNTDAAVRIWLFEDDEVNGTMYMKEEVDDGHYTQAPLYYNLPPTEFFQSSSVVFTREIIKLEPQQIKKYSIIMWFEDADYDCVNYGENSIAGGGLKLALRFNVKAIV